MGRAYRTALQNRSSTCPLRPEVRQSGALQDQLLFGLPTLLSLPPSELPNGTTSFQGWQWHSPPSVDTSLLTNRSGILRSPHVSVYSSTLLIVGIDSLYSHYPRFYQDSPSRVRRNVIALTIYTWFFLPRLFPLDLYFAHTHNLYLLRTRKYMSIESPNKSLSAYW